MIFFTVGFSRFAPSCFEEFLGGENVLGLVPPSLPRTLGYACTFYAPTSPPPFQNFGPGGVPLHTKRLPN